MNDNTRRGIFIRAYQRGVTYAQLNEKYVAELHKATSSPNTVLDIGGGRGELAMALTDLGAHVTVIDPAGSVLDSAGLTQKGIEYHVQQIHSYLRAVSGTRSYDAVWIKHAIRFIHHKRSLFSLLRHTVKQGAPIVIITPTLTDGSHHAQHDKSIAVREASFEALLSEYFTFRKWKNVPERPNLAVYVCTYKPEEAMPGTGTHRKIGR